MQFILDLIISKFHIILICALLGIAVSWMLAYIIDILPPYLYSKWHNNAVNLLGIKTKSSEINSINTRISHYKTFTTINTLLYITAAITAPSIITLIGYLVFISIIIVLVIIDYKTMLLPDELTIFLLWLGLLFNLHGIISGSLENSIYGAILGYGSLWIVFWAFKLITKKDGMGYGDFKFLAAILAWLGYEYLVPVILMSSMLGIIYYCTMILWNKISTTKVDFHADNAIPFGPYLGISAIILLFMGNHIINLIMR
jgi:leader peptidase (prepilin peptidase) / N-methyltransferase